MAAHSSESLDTSVVVASAAGIFNGFPSEGPTVTSVACPWSNGPTKVLNFAVIESGAYSLTVDWSGGSAAPIVSSGCSRLPEALTSKVLMLCCFFPT